MIYLFCGKKGVGKTTIVSLLSKYYNFFSDDSVNLSFNGNEIIGYKLNDIIKRNKDTFSMISKFANDEFNIFKKI